MIVGKRTKAHKIYAQKSMASIKYAINVIKSSRIAPYIHGLYLYGSCARKEQNYDSDVDLFLVLSPELDRKYYGDDILILKSKVTPPDTSLPEVDLKIEIGDDWENKTMLYYQNIKKEGIQLWRI